MPGDGDTRGRRTYLAPTEAAVFRTHLDMFTAVRPDALAFTSRQGHPLTSRTFTNWRGRRRASSPSPNLIVCTTSADTRSGTSPPPAGSAPASPSKPPPSGATGMRSSPCSAGTKADSPTMTNTPLPCSDSYANRPRWLRASTSLESIGCLNSSSAYVAGPPTTVPVSVLIPRRWIRIPAGSEWRCGGWRRRRRRNTGARTYRSCHPIFDRSDGPAGVVATGPDVALVGPSAACHRSPARRPAPA